MFPPTDKIIVYGTTWCGDCRRAVAALDRYQVDYRFINIDYDKAAEKMVIEHNRGFRSVPTILFPDGSILVEPSSNLILSKLGLS